MNKSTTDHTLVPPTLTSPGFTITFLLFSHQGAAASLYSVSVICTLQSNVSDRVLKYIQDSMDQL